jgi:hypothetical protein
MFAPGPEPPSEPGVSPAAGLEAVALGPSRLMLEPPSKVSVPDTKIRKPPVFRLTPGFTVRFA